MVELVEGGRKVAEVAADLGVSEQSIYTWRRQARIDAGVEAGLTSAEKAELAAAREGGSVSWRRRWRSIVVQPSC